MKKAILTSLIFILCIHLLNAAPIAINVANRIGQSFFKANFNLNLTDDDLVLVQNVHSGNGESISYYYVFNLGNSGFVIVAADDQVTPILGYSRETAFSTTNIPQSVAKWLEEYKSQIRFVIENNIPATAQIQAEWENYSLGITANNPSFERDVAPLIQTKWDQAPHVNALCPSGSVTGCVATAMAQVMKYWNHPANGAGIHSYNHQTYGTLSASFGSTSYQWSSMPNVVNSANNAVATLMYHCGVSVDMQYSPQVSGAYVIENSPTPQACSEYAFKNYFGYKPTLQGVQRDNYNETQWVNLMKAELDASRPILYAGFGSGGGHAFVCDGYDNNSYFHFNWGWGGAFDGFFSINALNPDGQGTGGGTGSYNSGHQAVIGVEPLDGGGGGGGNNNPQSFDLGLFNYVSPSSNTIYYGEAFSVTTNIVNNGTNTFNGDFCAAVFDSQSNFVDYVQTYTGNTLQGGYTYNNNIVFSTNGLFSMLPGTYYVGVFYRPTGGNWVIVNDNGSYYNSAQIIVINPNTIELNSNMVVAGGTTLTQGQPISVNLNVANAGTGNFYGQYGVGLFNLDGSVAQVINTYNETGGLPSGYTYLAPFLTFTNSAVTVAPGTYFLAVQHNPNNQGWQLTGSSYFQNPIYVTVQSAAIAPDQYEVNNTLAQAYPLNLNFNGNNANLNTVGSNLHNGTDYDYYKVNLSAGYNYTINARIHDSHNSGNGNTYTVDALFSISSDGTNWSSAFDDLMPGSATMQNGGVVYFQIAPYFSGEMGTYLLDINITRSQGGTVDIDDVESAASLLVYPNPARDFAYIDLSNSADKLIGIQLLNSMGQQIEALSAIQNKGVITLPLENLADGLYFVRIETTSGHTTQRLIVKK